MTLDGIIFMESSGVIREAFRARGLNVYSCDLLPADDGSPHHFQGDARKVIREHTARFYGFHPTCTYLCGSGIHWNDRGRGWEKTDAALGFILWCMSHTDTPYYLENPRGIISTMIRRPDQEIQPYQFGDDASKLTCLWLNKLPRLVIDPAKRVPGRMVLHNGKMVERWANQTDSGQNKLAPSDLRWKERSKSYPGIAAADGRTVGQPRRIGPHRMKKGITQSILNVLVANAPRAMSGAEVVAAIGRTDVTAGTIRTILGQRSRAMGKLPALWRKVGHDSYAA